MMDASFLLKPHILHTPLVTAEEFIFKNPCTSCHIICPTPTTGELPAWEMRENTNKACHNTQHYEVPLAAAVFAFLDDDEVHRNAVNFSAKKVAKEMFLLADARLARSWARSQSTGRLPSVLSIASNTRLSSQYLAFSALLTNMSNVALHKGSTRHSGNPLVQYSASRWKEPICAGVNRVIVGLRKAGGVSGSSS